MRIILLLLFITISCKSENTINEAGFKTSNLNYIINEREGYELLLIKSPNSQDTCFIKIDSKTGEILMMGQRNELGFIGQTSYFNDNKLYQIREWYQRDDDDVVNNSINFDTTDYSVRKDSDYFIINFDSTSNQLYFCDKYSEIDTTVFYGYELIGYPLRSGDISDTLFLGKKSCNTISLLNFDIKDKRYFGINRVLIDTVIDSKTICNVREYYFNIYGRKEMIPEKYNSFEEFVEANKN